ncbi:hypothetical protein THASP1DRAFT_29564 [Thamnocephalis sphaerospora]|uniref:F-box domain-containing protein n=1 Tax=Thamnocephalis sphaerospora TaxID=78915 RepID=A0A4P9XRQ3_9FUNG|nr:hypothetical protein THASP1DRAFT_29564 [Thamnocephalis sphaerospora]|eukprot:RKP08632.1 hypothetical protein THASP1DRAFT_29564 [Thamnocephalis sphaerospora]
MNRVPAEIVYRIVYLSDDEAALVALATTSRWLYACVAAQRKLWRLSFERDFPKQDENELRWLRHYARTHLAHLLFAKRRQEALLPTDELLDWFRVYCNRRATEYRWRHGLYTVRQPEQTTGTHIGGVRLQSIVISSRAARDMRVISQRVLAPQQQPVWIAEQLCWGGVDADSMLTTEDRHSDEYLVIAVEPPSMTMSAGSTNATLYVWQLNALHLPPRLIMSGFMGSINLYKNWLVASKHFMDDDTPGITVVFDLAKHTARPETLEGNVNRIHMQQATDDSIRLLWRDEIEGLTSHTTVLWRLWDLEPNRSPPMRCLTTCETQFYAGERYLKTCRIDDNRFAMFSQTLKHSADMPPTIKMMEILENNVRVTMKEKWSLAQELDDITPIVSRDLLLVNISYKSHKLVNLSDGSLVHDISIATLDCWSGCGLYPLRSRWKDMAKNITREHLKGDPSLVSAESQVWLPSSNARMMYVNDIPAVADYSI